MNTKESEMQQQIMQAAEELIMDRGFDATSTTDIARKVGCNQALVHYYFRTKENLFQQIFVKNIDAVLEFLDAYQFEGSVEDIVKKIVEAYFSVLSQHRKLPFIFVSQLLSNDDRRMFVRDYIVENERRRRVYYRFDGVVQRAVASGQIRPIKTLDLFMNIVSLIIFTFVSLPMYMDWLRKDEQEVQAYLQERQEEIVRSIVYSLRPL
ncbi:MAG: TetR/AcrR family transcriptional regulator [Paludibacteraceae bacterium]|nr:TetR/AcrR family transcriptional regulator [Paludibacteraceae bacterium]